MSAEVPADRWSRVQALLAEALEADPTSRAALLEDRCAGDAELRAEVESLLDAAERAGGYFGALADRAGLTLLATGPASDAAGPDGRSDGADAFVGRRVGQYRILSWLGSGGSASVYLAEREGEGFTQRVALKLVPRRTLDPLIRRRSHEERRILARLEHRGIARLIDGGLTPEGYPYYAMEYVDGSDLLTFCDDRRLTLRRRLELFLEVCQAVQFAHERLVIHCDLKPGNIFVTDEGHVKLLDFGVARMIDPNAAGDEATGFWFTPGYASPEQVRREPAGTHSDVYALGVVLYEILTGHRPYRFGGRDLDEIRRVVCERVPELPSRAVTEPATWRRDGEEAVHAPEEIAARRGTTPDGLRRALRGDLDAIVMRSLAKRPEERYHTVEQLAGDVRRHLEHQLVSSVDATPRYRLTKAVRRHRGALLSGALVAAALVAGAAATLWQAARAQEANVVARQEAESAELVASLMLDIFRLSDPSRALGDTITARQILDQGTERILSELGGQPAVQARLLSDVSGVYANLGLFDRAEPLVRRALEIRERALGPESVEASESLVQLGRLRAEQGDVLGSVELLERAIALREPQVERTDSTLLLAKASLAWQVRSTGEHDRAASLFTDALAGERARDPDGPHVANIMLGLAATYHDAGSFDRADSLFRSALADMDPTAGPTPAAVSALTNVGMIQRLRERFHEAEPLLRTAVDMAVVLYGTEHATVLTAESEWGLALYGTGRWSEAEAMYRDAIDRSMRTLGPMHPTTSSLLEGLALILGGRGAFDEALALYLRGMEERRARYGAVDHPAYVASLNRIADAQIDLGRLDEARRTLAEATEMNRRLGPGPSVYTILSEQSRARIAWRTGRLAEAERHFEAALELADELLRPDHRYTQRLKRDYGAFLGETGRTAEARSVLLWVLETQERLLGSPHPQIDRTRALLEGLERGSR